MNCEISTECDGLLWYSIAAWKKAQVARRNIADLGKYNILKSFLQGNRRRLEIQFAVFLLCISGGPKNCSTAQTDKFRQSRDDDRPIFEADRQKRELR